jgi:hypothetical protein
MRPDPAQPSSQYPQQRRRPTARAHGPKAVLRGCCPPRTPLNCAYIFAHRRRMIYFDIWGSGHWGSSWAWGCWHTRRTQNTEHRTQDIWAGQEVTSDGTQSQNTDPPGTQNQKHGTQGTQSGVNTARGGQSGLDETNKAGNTEGIFRRRPPLSPFDSLLNLKGKVRAGIGECVDN